MNTGILREIIQLCQFVTIIDAPADFLAVMLHKMVFEHAERFCYALADCNTRHHNNELAPAILLVELKHRLDVDVCLTGAGLHFDVKIYHAMPFGECGARYDLVFHLHLADIGEKLLIIEFNIGVTITRVLVL